MPTPPYYAVVFTSERSQEDFAGYGDMAASMERLASQQPGYLGIESVRDPEGHGITVSYWSDLESIRNWKAVFQHQQAQQRGRELWYRRYNVKICRVEREYGFEI